jgi:hypothetical protein
LYDVVLFPFPGKGYLSTHFVIDDEIPFPWHFESNDSSTSLRLELSSGFFIKSRKFSAVEKRTTCGLRFLAFCIKFLWGCKVSIGEAGVKKSFGCRCVSVRTLRLKIWPMITSNARALIPSNPKPFQAFENWFQSGFQITDFIGVIDPQNEFATVALCKQPIE